MIDIYNPECEGFMFSSPLPMTKKLLEYMHNPDIENLRWHVEIKGRINILEVSYRWKNPPIE